MRDREVARDDLRGRAGCEAAAGMATSEGGGDGQQSGRIAALRRLLWRPNFGDNGQSSQSNVDLVPSSVAMVG